MHDVCSEPIHTNPTANDPLSGRGRLVDTTGRWLAQRPPSAISARFLAKEAGVHPTFVGQCFTPLSLLFEQAHNALAERFMGDIEVDDVLMQVWTEPQALAGHSDYWRAHVHLMLDDIDVHLARDHPVQHLQRAIARHQPRQSSIKGAGLAAAWWSMQIGVLVFERPLDQGFGVTPANKARVKRQVHAVIDALIRGRTPRLQKTSIVTAAEQLPPFGPAEGRQGAEHALLRAAMQLFCERVDVGVSGRELSKLADVNYGLIHHYFGSKEAVFDQAFVRLHDHYVKDMMSVPSYERSQRMTQHESFLRGWAARELSGSALPSIELKGMRALLQQLIERRGIDRRNNMAMAAARAQSYAVTAMLLGWTLCRPLLSTALQTDESTLLGYLLAIQDHILKEKFQPANV